MHCVVKLRAWLNLLIYVVTIGAEMPKSSRTRLPASRSANGPGKQTSLPQRSQLNTNSEQSIAAGYKDASTHSVTSVQSDNSALFAEFVAFLEQHRSTCSSHSPTQETLPVPQATNRTSGIDIQHNSQRPTLAGYKDASTPDAVTTMQSDNSALFAEFLAFLEQRQSSCNSFLSQNQVTPAASQATNLPTTIDITQPTVPLGNTSSSSMFEKVMTATLGNLIPAHSDSPKNTPQSISYQFLGSHLSPRLMSKICSDEFVELYDLLPSTSPSQSLTIQLSDGSNPSMSISQPRSKAINSIEQWTDAFLIFMSIYSSAHPDSTRPLLKYISIIRDLSRRFPGWGWRDYDLQFRRLRSVHPLPWETVHTELWLRAAMQPALPSNFNRQPQPSQGTSTKGPANLQSICHSFQYNTCSRPECKFLHICRHCSGKHPGSTCRKRPNTNYLSSRTQVSHPPNARPSQ